MVSFLIKRLLGFVGFTVMRTERYDLLHELEHYKPTEDEMVDHLRRVFDVHRIDTVFDVGANDGAYAEMLRNKVRFAGTIHSFEPIPAQITTLREKARADPKWIIHACGLGAKAGTLPFHVMQSDVFSSFRKPSASQPDKYSDSNIVVQTVEVPVRTVAEVMRELPASRVHLKMDTQGFDLEVFAGAAGVLQQIPSLQSELALRTVYDGAPDWREAMSTYERAGYSPSILRAISFDDALRCIEIDSVFVR